MKVFKTSQSGLKSFRTWDSIVETLVEAEGIYVRSDEKVSGIEIRDNGVSFLIEKKEECDE